MISSRNRAKMRRAKPEQGTVLVWAPTFVAMLRFEAGRCVEAPENLGAAVGRSFFTLYRHCKRHGWHVERLS